MKPTLDTIRCKVIGKKKKLQPKKAKVKCVVKSGEQGKHGRAPNIAQNQIAKRSESEIFFAKNCEAKRSEIIFGLCEANNFSKLRKIAKNCEIAKKILGLKKYLSASIFLIFF